MNKPDPLITPQELADILKISRKSLTRRVEAGDITPVMVGSTQRFRSSDVYEYLGIAPRETVINITVTGDRPPLSRLERGVLAEEVREEWARVADKAYLLKRTEVVVDTSDLAAAAEQVLEAAEEARLQGVFEKILKQKGGPINPERIEAHRKEYQRDLTACERRHAEHADVAALFSACHSSRSAWWRSLRKKSPEQKMLELARMLLVQEAVTKSKEFYFLDALEYPDHPSPLSQVLQPQADHVLRL